MPTTTTTSTNAPRYHVLDGLRGVAAILVIIYHFGEAFATSPVDQFMNHGYLAVDFFFVLSGFVIGYAYDSRWKQAKTDRPLTPWSFMLRRLIRLQPMVLLAVILGAVAFIIQGSQQWDHTPVPLSAVILALLLGLFFIPAWPGAFHEVRGNGEMFPLNGPAWSLFFEYLGSILYAFWLHRLSTPALRRAVIISGAALACCALCNLSGAYHIGFGWSLADLGWLGGLARLSFSFSAGLLMTRSFTPRRIRGAFWICAALIALILSCPYVGSTSEPSILNALYDLAATLLLFPLIVYIGACGSTTDRFSTATCSLLGQTSYPVYIIHYPAMYLFYAWVWNNAVTPAEALPVCAVMLPAILLAAYAALRLYDQPLRRLLSRKLINNP